MTPNSSILEVFASGNATVDQWLGLFVLAVAGFVGFIALLRQHVADTRDEGRARK